MAILRMAGVSKLFGQKAAVEPLDLQVESGEFFSVLGPSGCGKTTLLRMVAGFERPTTGRVFLDDKDVTDLPAGKRGVGMVFQNYALFPRMTVGQNVGFGLRKEKLSSRALESRITKALESVHLADRARSHVAELSGGEQQRVAVARAMIVEPGVLLFDEPLSNLDAALRSTTRNEIKLLQQRTGITTLYVTHDQSEAMSLSTRVGIMRNGVMLQVDTPIDAYARPRTPFVAGFLGAANLLDATIDRKAGQISVRGSVFPMPAESGSGLDGEVCAAIKPEHVKLSRPGERGTVEGEVISVEYQGFLVTVLLSVRGVQLRAIALAASLQPIPAGGDRIGLAIDWSRCSFFDREQ